MSLFVRSLARKAAPVALRSPQVVCAGSVRLSSYYAKSHEYVNVEGSIGTCGITDFAQSALGDIVFVDLPEVGDECEKDEPYGSVESVKAASDVYAPVSGKVVAINDALLDDPSLVNVSAEDEAWFIKVEMSNPDDVGDMMDPAAYKAFCESEEAN
uniref:Glycine cleavage system H protein n=1 Tax=Cyclophora tenuis TaxID=216820 RepID=A0A7S1D0C8_CYCTE|mmetsp:Transcript_17196/g.29169  ORF Transcript_17196/g.29169 Transcript_17196/m.29169 type:complete len:156 (+) Transcript_17196:1043-1510(+)